MYLIYFLLGVLAFWGSSACRRGEWNEDYTSLKQTKMLLGLTALLISFHHMGQKTCAPWHQQKYIIHGLDFFVNIGYIFVAIFFFCSGLGLYKSFKNKKDYLKGFIVRRIVPIVIAFYLSEVIYLVIRLIMREKMGPKDVIWYLSGLHMANFNSWYAIIIPFFYLAFYLAFRFCKKEGTAILWVFIAAAAYTVLGACLGHPQGWWMRGEWWYNSIILFPIGLLFGKHEEKITAFFKKAYPVLLPLSFVSVILFSVLSKLATDVWWGYYGEYSRDPLTVPHRIGSAASQWLVCISVVLLCFLFMMKVRIGNKVLAFFGGLTFEFYLMHGIFVELFGYDFLEMLPSIYYIKNVPLYIVVVIACAIPLTLLYSFIWKTILRVLGIGKSRVTS